MRACTVCGQPLPAPKPGPGRKREHCPDTVRPCSRFARALAIVRNLAQDIPDTVARADRQRQRARAKVSGIIAELAHDVRAGD